MERNTEFIDLLAERRKESDFLWVSRSTEPLASRRLPPEAKYSRSRAIEEALASPKVLLAVESLAAARNVEKSVVRREAYDMLEEMASKAHLPTVRWIGLLLVKVLKRILLSFRVNQKYVLEMRSRMRDSDYQYVYAPTHRSYLDFVLMSYILFTHDMALPNIASGMDFYRMRIVGELLRKTGAFYMRRSFSADILYKEIFRAYVLSLVAHSDRAIEFFIEGTRSRSQKSLAPKYGLLAMILEGLFQGDVPDIQFVPISITYDRPLEELLFTYELLGEPKPVESTTALLRSLSILRESQGHGHVHFNIAPPISAREYVTSSIRKMTLHTPNAKLPSETVTKLAYAIIEAHKENTIFTPFNLIAVLYNEKVQSYPEDSYTIETLIKDYRWLKNIVTGSFGATVSPISDDNYGTEIDVIIESLNVHKDLLAFDSKTFLTLKERHHETHASKNRKVKGHLLENRTMRIAVPTINLAIYVNPIFALFSNISLCILAIHRSDVAKDTAFQQYFFLRSLLSTEFALPLDIDKSAVINEWEKSISFLINENCLSIENEHFIPGKNIKLRNLLRNLIRPFAVVVYIVSLVMHEWDEATMGNKIENHILKESQRRTESLLFKEDPMVQHPYTLSLDLYQSTLIGLVAYGAINLRRGTSTYEINEDKLSSVIVQLEKILVPRPHGTYMSVVLQFSHRTDNTLQAKL